MAVLSDILDKSEGESYCLALRRALAELTFSRQKCPDLAWLGSHR